MVLCPGLTGSTPTEAECPTLPVSHYLSMYLLQYITCPENLDLISAT